MWMRIWRHLLLKPPFASIPAATPVRLFGTDAPISNADQVTAALSQAGLSPQGVAKVLQHYKHYLNWDVDHKLIPRLRIWQQRLGDAFSAEMVGWPRMLLRTPQQQDEKFEWLDSIGGNSKVADQALKGAVFGKLKKGSRVFHSRGWSEQELRQILPLHQGSLVRSTVGPILDVIEELFPHTESCCQTAAIIANCRSVQLFQRAPQQLRARMLYFRARFEADATAFKRAFALGAFTASEVDMDMKAEFVAQVLAASREAADRICRRMPQLLRLSTANTTSTVDALQSLGFSLPQVRELCIKQPALLTCNFTSKLHTEKWHFLTCVLQLTPDNFVAEPHLLTASLSARLAPRWDYLQRLKSMQAVSFSHAREVASCLCHCSDDQFARRFSRAQSLLGPFQVFKSSWLQTWQSRWHGMLPAVANM